MICSGAARLTGPTISSWSMTCRIAPTSSASEMSDHHCLSRAEPSTRAEPQDREPAAEGPAVGVGDRARARVHHADARLAGRVRRRLPGDADAGEERRADRPGLVDAVGPGVAVVAAGRARDEHAGRRAALGDRGRQAHRGRDPPVEDLPLVGVVPALAGHARARQVDHRAGIVDRIPYGEVGPPSPQPRLPPHLVRPPGARAARARPRRARQPATSEQRRPDQPRRPRDDDLHPDTPQRLIPRV